MKAVRQLMERLVAAESVASRKGGRFNLARLSAAQLGILDAFMKEVNGLDGDARRSKWVDFLYRNSEIAALLNDSTAAGTETRGNARTTYRAAEISPSAPHCA